MACDLVPGREHDVVPVAAGHAPLLVVVLVVGRVVVPAAAVRLEDRSLPLEGEVVAIGVTVPLEWELAHEVGDAVRERAAVGSSPRVSTVPDGADRVGAGAGRVGARRRAARVDRSARRYAPERRYRCQPPTPSVLARDLRTPRPRASPPSCNNVHSTPVVRQPAYPSHHKAAPVSDDAPRHARVLARTLCGSAISAISAVTPSRP